MKMMSIKLEYGWKLIKLCDSYLIEMCLFCVYLLSIWMTCQSQCIILDNLTECLFLLSGLRLIRRKLRKKWANFHKVIKTRLT